MLIIFYKVEISIMAYVYVTHMCIKNIGSIPDNKRRSLLGIQSSPRV